MQPVFLRHRRGRRALALVAAGTALVAGAVGAPTPAQAAFSLDACESTATVNGRGATFSTSAFNNAFAPGFSLDSSGCPGWTGTIAGYNTGFVTSDKNGSGNGRGAFGSGEGNAAPMNVAGQRDNDVRYAGSDEGPEASRQNQMNSGNVATTADDGKAHVIPIVAGAVTLMVNYPTWDDNGDAGGTTPTAPVTCPIPSTYATGDAGNFNRIRVPNWKWEKAWHGDYLTWGDFLEDLDGAGNAFTGLNTTTVPDTDASGDNTAEQARFTAQCANKKLLRVVRQDNSGSTFAFKDFLNEAAKINDNSETTPNPLTGDGTTTNWKPGLTGNPTDNRRWPNTPSDTSPDGDTQDPIFGETADGTTNVCDPAYITAATTSPVCHAAVTGGSALRAVALANNGSISYAVLADSIGANRFSKDNTATDSTFLSPVAVRDSVTNYVEPAVNGAAGTQGSNASGGAPCSTLPVNGVPSGTDPTLTVGGWDPTSMVFPASGYGICTLSYALAWDDNKPIYVDGLNQPYAAEEGRARVVKDFLTYAASDQGQARLAARDYSAVPENIQAIAQAGIAAIGWDKNAQGNSGDTNPPVDNTPKPGGGGNTTPTPTPTPTPVAPPAAVTPSNAFTVPSARTKGTDILASFRFPGAGRVVVTAKGKYTEKAGVKKRKKGTKSVTVGRATVNVTRAGDVQVKLPMSSAAKKALKRTAKITVTITAVYTPTGGAPRTVTKTLSVRGK